VFKRVFRGKKPSGLAAKHAFDGARFEALVQFGRHFREKSATCYWVRFSGWELPQKGAKGAKALIGVHFAIPARE